jgi:ferritin-like metal-binding protein YciE
MRANSESSDRSRSNRTSVARGNANSSGRDGSATANARQAGAEGAGHFEGQSHLEKFFLDQLQDIYYAEQKIVQSLPKMQQAATTGELKEAFEDHLHQTQRHVKRLEKVFETLGKKAEGKKCEAIEGIAREVETIIRETEEGTLTRDAALIIAAQKVEHYEIATYGGLVQLAITMQLHDAADLLDKTLVEEEDTDARLTEIAENEINLGAEHEGNQYSWDAQGEENGEEDVDEESPSV